MEDEARRIAETIARVEHELGLDWRSSYSKIAVASAASLDVELSREAVFRALPVRLAGFAARRAEAGETVLEAPDLTVRLRLLAPSAGKALWTVSSVADVRREPAHSAELLTQLIMGETADCLKEEGDWYLVRLADGYHGWVRSWYIREADAATIESYARGANALVAANVGYVYSAPDARSAPVSDVVSGVRLRAADPERDFRRVSLPGERAGFMREGDLAELPSPGPPERGRIVERARRFLGIPYLWGGTSAKGFDCSGLVQRVYLMEGIALPRDSDRQALVGRLVAREAIGAASPGDLLFFGEGGKVSHVGIYAGEGAYIHARGDVRINNLLPEDDRFDAKLAGMFLFGRAPID